LRGIQRETARKQSVGAAKRPSSGLAARRRANL
jgi:hypothetical protein